MGSSLISYGPIGTPPGSSRCPNGIARCTKVHLKVRQMDAQKCLWRCARCSNVHLEVHKVHLEVPKWGSSCPNGSPDCPGALSKGGQLCESRIYKFRMNMETVDPSAVPKGTC